MPQEGSEALTPPPQPDSAEKPVLTDRQTRLVKEAIGTFDNMLSATQGMKAKDEPFNEGARLGLNRTIGMVGNGNPRELGFQQVQLAADELRGSLTPQLNKLYQESDSFGVGIAHERQEIEQLLIQAGLDDDPIRSYALAEDARERFNHVKNKLNTSREESKGARNTIVNRADESATVARILYSRMQEAVGRNSEGGVVHEYSLNTYRLVQFLEEGNVALTGAERAYIEGLDKNSQEFASLVQELIKKDAAGPTAQQPPTNPATTQ